MEKFCCRHTSAFQGEGWTNFMTLNQRQKCCVCVYRLEVGGGRERETPYWHSWSSSPFIDQLVKNLPAMQETRVQFLGWKIPWRRKWQPTPVFLSVESHGQRSLAGGYSPWGCKSRTRLSDQTTNTTLSAESQASYSFPILLSTGGVWSYPLATGA